MIHCDTSQSDSTDVPLWLGTHEVGEAQLSFVPLSWASHGIVHKRYPDGTDVLITTGNAEIAKFIVDGASLRLVNQLVAPGQEAHFAPAEETAALVAAMDAAYMDEDAYLAPLLAYMEKYKQGVDNGAYGVYSVLDVDGALYTGYGTSLVRFEDVDPTDPKSELQLVGITDVRDHMDEELAATVSRFLGINISYDGYIVAALSGVVAVISRDLTDVSLAPLPGEAIDNGLALDEDGGIYVVTSQYMRKLIWTGTALSTEEADGAWKATYPYAKDKKALWLSRGAGATPTLMGFGSDEDHLVVLSDAGDPVKFMAFWRDAIPADARHVEGADSRRLADAITIDFPVATTIEWSPQVLGDRVLTFASDFPDPILTNREHAMQLTLMSLGYTRKAPRGAQCFRWDRTQRRFSSQWLYTDRTMCWTLSPVSSASNAVYLNTLENGEYRVVGLDWETGEEVARLELPNTFRFNTAGQFLLPLNEHTLVSSGAFGPVLITHD
jgi:hypothetical protein